MKKQTVRPTRDDVARLIEGKKSLNRVGSRAVAHRLRNFEKERLELAKRSGVLLAPAGTRDALLNAWFMWCDAVGIPFKIRQ